MEGITPEQLMNTVVVVMAVLAAIVAIDKAADVFRKWKRPQKDMSEMLRTDKQRLDEHERDIKVLKDGQEALCTGVVALLDHQLHNGNSDQMEKAKERISNYLSGLIAR